MLRTAMAVLFGFMSLAHGPVMTFVKASPATHHAMAEGHAGHHQHHTASDQSPAGENNAPLCYAFGCFVTLDATPIRVPAAILFLVGTVSPAPADAMLAGTVEPAVPPPRLPV